MVLVLLLPSVGQESGEVFAAAEAGGVEVQEDDVVRVGSGGAIRGV